jgi:ribonuclease P/MRP protein subunit POP5
MVRIKNRYLLVNILYPELSTLASKTPDLIAFNAPTTSELTSHLLLKAIRDAILELFGDYGAGAVASSLMSMYYLYGRRGMVSWRNGQGHGQG